MVDHIVDTSERRGGVDIRVGVGRRRRWRSADKGRIVAESYAPGAVVSEVARRHDITPQHLFAWRKAARAGRLTLPAEEAPMFVPVVTTIREVGADAAANGPESIVIEIAGAMVRAQRGVDLGWLRDVLRAVKAAR
jgi:transposase